MAEAPPEFDASESSAGSAPAGGGPGWAEVWHLPVLGVGVVLFVLGLVLSVTGGDEPPPFDWGGALDNVGLKLRAGDTEQADALLKNLEPTIATAPDTEQARYWQYLGDLNFEINRGNGPIRTDVVDNNNRLIVRYYQTSEQFGRPLDPAALRRYAQTLVALDRLDAALAIVDRMRDDPPAQRYQIIRAMIDHVADQHGGVPPANIVGPLLVRFEEELVQELDPQRQMAQKVWATGLQAEMMLAADDPGRAINYLIKEMQQIKARARQAGISEGMVVDRQLAPIMLLLARAYQDEGSLDNAERWYRLAQQWLPRGDELHADALIGLGQIELARGGNDRIQTALELFTQAARQYPSREQTYALALIGKGDAAARLGVHEEAMDDFRLAVDELLRTTTTGDSRRTRLIDVVSAHVEFANDAGEHERALAYLNLVKTLDEPDLPADLLLDLAVTHEAVARQKQAHAIDLEQGPKPGEKRDAIRLANQEASVHFARSASYYLRHARAVTIADDEAHGLSLWNAGQNFDNAQYWDEAIGVWSEFIKTRQNDPLRLRATNRLGKAYMADGQYAPAVELFLFLLREHPHSPETYDSLVPLARAHVALKEYDAALRGLRSVVEDHPAITPDSEAYREALIELGKLLYRMTGDDPAYAVPAIERLTEAVERYGDSRDGASLRFLLADAYRKSVPAIDQDLATRIANAEQVALMKERKNRLDRAQVYYNQAINQFEALGEASLSPLEKLQLRNAYFYQADCAFDNQHYQEAIRLYDEAARRWQDHPASLVALVQKVNAYCELGLYQEAKTANDHALWQLGRIPEEKFDDPSLPMSRAHWEDWLRWTSELELLAEAESANLPVGAAN